MEVSSARSRSASRAMPAVEATMDGWGRSAALLSHLQASRRPQQAVDRIKAVVPSTAPPRSPSMPGGASWARTRQRSRRGRHGDIARRARRWRNATPSPSSVMAVLTEALQRPGERVLGESSPSRTGDISAWRRRHAGATFEEARPVFYDPCTEMTAIQSVPQPVCARMARWRLLPATSSSPVATSPLPPNRRPSPSRVARVGCSATHPSSPSPASGASGRWRWRSPATRSTPPRQQNGGLVNRVVPDADLDAAVADLMRRAAGRPPRRP